MPELPEVETVRRSLLPLQGQCLEKTSVLDGKLRYQATGKLTQKIHGEKLEQISRLGKYLLLKFPSDTLVFHLGMTGRMLIGQKKKSPYAKVLFHFEKDRLDFIDVRRFGFVLSGAAAQKALPTGIDGLDKLDAEKISARILQSRAAIKALLLDQKIIAGLGNIYVSEILFLAKVHPAKRGIDLRRAEIELILKATPKVLKRAIEAKGSSISDFVYALPGEKEYSTGNYQSKFLVYSRDGAACKVCKAKIMKIVQGARSSFFCPECQVALRP
jgi:formamidopyrimidine-DNA glycosylase